MDLTIEHKLNEKEAKHIWRKAFFAFAAPGYVLGVIYILLCILIGLHNENWGPFLFVFAAIIAVSYLLAWPRTWKMYREIFQRQGAFEHPTFIHLTDAFFKTSCGENHSKQEYRIFTHYLCLKDCIVLIHKRSIMSVIEKKEFPDEGAEWISCLEANGVERKRLWGLKRWWIVLVFLLLLVFCMYVYVAARRANDEWCEEKSAYTACVNNLKTIGTALVLYAEDNQGYYPTTLRSLLPQEYSIDEENLCCPETEMGYKYVPYGKMNDETAAEQPIVIDYAGSHWIKQGLWGKCTLRTPILFADGHVEIFSYLASYMDIYDQYAKSLREEDAKVLKNCCEDWDKELDEAKE